jgi:hypothetical protein
MIRNTKPPRGVVMAHFILWYGFLRIFVDFYREYRTDLYGFPPGQEFNLFMTFVGVGLLFWFYQKKKSTTISTMHSSSNTLSSASSSGLWKKRVTFALLLILPSIIPGDWTHDIPERYGHRHPGLTHSAIYPKVEVYNETKPIDKIENKEINTEKLLNN